MIGLSSANEFYDINIKDLDGVEVNLSAYRAAKVILVVNVASNDGYTYRQYNELKTLHERYYDDGKGLVILGFPCNQVQKCDIIHTHNRL